MTTHSDNYIDQYGVILPRSLVTEMFVYFVTMYLSKQKLRWRTLTLYAIKQVRCSTHYIVHYSIVNMNRKRDKTEPCSTPCCWSIWRRYHIILNGMINIEITEKQHSVHLKMLSMNVDVSDQDVSD